MNLTVHFWNVVSFADLETARARSFSQNCKTKLVSQRNRHEFVNPPYSYIKNKCQTSCWSPMKCVENASCDVKVLHWVLTKPQYHKSVMIE